MLASLADASAANDDDYDDVNGRNYDNTTMPSSFFAAAAASSKFLFVINFHFKKAFSEHRTDFINGWMYTFTREYLGNECAAQQKNESTLKNKTKTHQTN